MSVAALGVVVAVQGIPAGAAPSAFTWETVVNSNDLMPPLDTTRFNSYNQPSVNARGLVVMRARSRGNDASGQTTHGIYARDMGVPGSPIVRVLDRGGTIAHPNNTGARLVETPSFPRIDIGTDTTVTRGNHQPVWRHLVGTDPATGEAIETRAGTTGIYTAQLQAQLAPLQVAPRPG
jgi:hypothetical protein